MNLKSVNYLIFLKLNQSLQKKKKNVLLKRVESRVRENSSIEHKNIKSENIFVELVPKPVNVCDAGPNISRSFVYNIKIVFSQKYKREKNSMFLSK